MEPRDGKTEKAYTQGRIKEKDTNRFKMVKTTGRKVKQKKRQRQFTILHQ